MPRIYYYTYFFSTVPPLPILDWSSKNIRRREKQPHMPFFTPPSPSSISGFDCHMQIGSNLNADKSNSPPPFLPTLGTVYYVGTYQRGEKSLGESLHKKCGTSAARGVISSLSTPFVISRNAVQKSSPSFRHSHYADTTF